MAHRYIIDADDFGLSRGITDSILETFDLGALTSTSILPNGESVEYALQEYAKRAEKLRLAVHLNLTEGLPLSVPSDIPLLVDTKGGFRHSSTSLMFSYMFASGTRKAQFRNQVRSELTAQWQYIRTHASVTAADGHQHVHMIPFVFDVVTKLPGITYIRVPTEPLYYVRGYVLRYFGIHALTRFFFLFLGHRNRAHAAASGIGTNDHLLGLLFSGHMTFETVTAGLSALKRFSTGVVEIIFHPGIAKESELRIWRGTRADIAWHFSPARAAEKALLTSPRFRELLDKAQN